MNEGSEIRSEALGSENLTKGDGPGIVKAVVSLAAEETRTAINASPRLGSFFSSVSGYFSACRHVQSLDEWMRLNKQRFGSEILYADEVAGGWIIGYAAGVSVKHALKIGLLLVGAGYVAVQVRAPFCPFVHWGWQPGCSCFVSYLFVRRHFRLLVGAQL